jgi:hypothetical protein
MRDLAAAGGALSYQNCLFAGAWPSAEGVVWNKLQPGKMRNIFNNFLSESGVAG